MRICKESRSAFYNALYFRDEINGKSAQRCYAVRDMGYEVSYTSRGALMIRVPGCTGARLCLAAHGDTLGVQASHHMERTRVKGMENTLELIKGYIGL